MAGFDRLVLNWSYDRELISDELILEELILDEVKQ
jgi:hypothetical protein